MKNKNLLIILFVGLVLRLININQSLWLDEGINVVNASTLNLRDLIFSYSLGDFHPPLYHILMYWTIKLFGNSEVAVRMPSVLFGVITVYFSYKIALKLFEEKTALIAATLMTTAPLAIYYSQEARMYSMAAMFTTISVYFFLSLLDKDKLLNWVGFIIATVLVLYSDYVPYFIIPAYLIYLFIFKKKIKISTLKSFLPAFILITILILPIIYILPKQLDVGTSAAIISPAWASVVGAPSINNLLLTFVKFSIGRISNDNNLIYFLQILPAGIFILMITLISLFRLSSKRFFLWLWILVPISIAFTISFLVPIYAYFRFIFVLPAFYLILSSGINTLNHKFITRSFLYIMITINLIATSIYFINPRFHRENWRDATSFIHSDSSQSTLVLFESNFTMSPFDYYNKNKVEARGALKKWNPNGAEDLTNINELTSNKNTIYLFQYLAQITDPQELVFQEITKNGFISTQTKNFNGVGFIYEFKRIK